MVRFQSDGQGAALLSVFRSESKLSYDDYFFFPESNFILPWAILHTIDEQFQTALINAD